MVLEVRIGTMAFSSLCGIPSSGAECWMDVEGNISGFLCLPLLVLKCPTYETGRGWLGTSILSSVMPKVDQSSSKWGLDEKKYSLPLSHALPEHSLSNRQLQAAWGMLSFCSSWKDHLLKRILGKRNPTLCSWHCQPNWSLCLANWKGGGRVESWFKCHRFWQFLLSFSRFSWTNISSLTIKTILPFPKTLKRLSKAFKSYYLNTFHQNSWERVYGISHAAKSELELP